MPVHGPWASPAVPSTGPGTGWAGSKYVLREWKIERHSLSPNLPTFSSGTKREADKMRGSQLCLPVGVPGELLKLWVLTDYLQDGAESQEA